MRACLPLIAACVLLGSPLFYPATAVPTAHPKATVHSKKKPTTHHTKPKKHQTAKKSKHRATHHGHRSARRRRGHGAKGGWTLVGLLVPINSALGQTVVKRPGTIAVVQQSTGSADFLYGGMPQYNSLTGAELDMAGNGPNLRAIGYFGVTLPPGTELTDFNLIQQSAPMLNTATGQLEQYGEFVARIDITNPHVLARLAKEHAKREEAQKKHEPQQPQKKQQTAKAHLRKHKAPKEKTPVPPQAELTMRLHSPVNRAHLHVPRAGHTPHRPVH